MVASATVLAVVIVAAVSYVLQSRGQQLLEQLCASPQVLRALEHVPAALNPCQVRADASPAASAECATTASTDCQYQHVESANEELLPLLLNVTQTPYFRYFKVNLFCDCPLWPEDGMCAMEACSVCECGDDEVPPAWLGDDEEYCQTRLNRINEESTVNRSLAANTEEELMKLVGWAGLDNPWLPELDANVEYSYINLQVNPERFTGYTGEHANRIWDAIYSQNCFKNVHSEQCDEESLVFYRIISGVHASISMHIAREYLLDESTDAWGTNMDIFKERMADPAKCDHVRNLYFTYLFVSRAVARASLLFKGVHFDTGMPQEDLRTKELMEKVASSPILASTCNLPFDLGRMWKGEQGPQLKQELQSHFQNITSIMDCVGCEKCKLWGKLQFLGVATALKILFASDDCFAEGGRPVPPKQMLESLKLERNEVIALVNLLTKLSHSVSTYRSLSQQLFEDEGVQPCIGVSDLLA